MSSKKKTTATKEDGKPALVPKLRFPEFQDADGWKDIPVASVLEVRDERRVPSTEAPLYSLTIESGITEKTDRYNREFLVRDTGNKKYKLVEPNDIVYNPSNLRWGAINYSQLSHSVVVSPIYEVLRLRDNSEDFLEFIACSIMRVEQIGRFVTKGQGTLVERIAVKIEDFLSTRLPVPATRAEQQKIASCLSSVDELMAAQGRKVDALKTHKKGLMQQLFPREGETQPRLRFPEFQNARGWIKMTLGQAATFYNGRAYKQEELLESGKYPVLRVGNFFTNKNWYYSDLELQETKYCDDGDLLYAWSASFGPRVWNGGKVIYHYHIWKVEERRGIDRQFLFITLENETERMKAQSANGLGLLHITKGTIEGWESSFPPQPAEQQRIATCLSSLDALITAETQKLEALKTHKRGLMQQLFPSPEEIEA